MDIIQFFSILEQRYLGLFGFFFACENDNRTIEKVFFFGDFIGLRFFPLIIPHGVIIFHVVFSTENSPESNYVPGSFSAKGRSKLRSPNISTPAAPANLDKAINQVCFE